MSFQEWVLRLPVKQYGWGVRRLEETCGPAYLGALETALPYMDSIAPCMEGVWGGRECWGGAADTDRRWSVVLSSGSREGRELREVWSKLKGEAVESADWLGREVEEVFVAGVEGVGGGSVTGETRGKIVEAREKTRALLLSKALGLHRPKKARHVWSWRQRDKLSTAWLLALPGPDSALSNAEFTEAAAASLCLPSPACQDMLGETIPARGSRQVDTFGDNVQAAALKGDHWRQRHDQLKFTIYRLCQWAGMPVEMEVFNLFSGLIPQQGLARIDKDRQRQSMVPDFKITLPWEGRTRPVLHELKVISCSKSRYKPTWKNRAVDKRAENLHQEYLDKATNTDRKFGGVEEGRIAPVESKLLSFPHVQGMVFGSFGEASEAVHSLVIASCTSLLPHNTCYHQPCQVRYVFFSVLMMTCYD